MAGMKIQAHESPIGDVLNNQYRFTIPLYQRPYAWTVEQAGEMVDDLLGSALSGESLAETDPYFLGSIVLVKGEDSADAEVIDGQQRLTTLTVLLSVIRDYVSPQYASSLNDKIFQKGDPIMQIVDQPRLKLRPQDHWFFEQHVQRREGLATVPSLVTDQLPESQRLLIHNARLFQQRFAQLSLPECERLVQFVVQRTYLVVVATQNFESAYRIFTVLNERGLDLSIADVLKSEVIGSIPADEQDSYAKRWEAEEEDLGRTEFDELFSHIRMVYAKTKARGAILKEFRSSVLRHHPDGRVFIDTVLVPLSDAYEVVTHASYRASGGAEPVNQLLYWLNTLDNVDWVPPAISYVRRQDVTAQQLERFLADLERLAASMFVRRVDITRRIDRYGSVLDALESGTDLYAASSPLQLTSAEKEATLEKLSSDVYNVIRTRLFVLLRLDAALSAGGVTHDQPIITVEHVLPQHPRGDSRWLRSFTKSEREYWTHRLANLVLLPRRKNSEASNLDFDDKKQKYFTSKTGVAVFALTTQVLAAKRWTPELLKERQEALLGVLADLWRLDPDS